MLWLLSWKNVWRNKLRSTVVIIAVTLGVFSSVFILAFMNGLVESRIKSIVETEISHIQIHKTGFVENNDFSVFIKEADSIVNKIKPTNHVLAVSKRIIISTMVATAETNTGVKIMGVVAEDEKNVTNISQKIVEGTYFETSKRNPVVIGKKLAEKLKVKIKNKIIITLQDIDKNITSGAFRVVGIFESENELYDESTIFVQYSDICALTGLQGTEAHEIAILLDNNDMAQPLNEKFKKTYPDLLVQYWMEISPEAGSLLSAMDQMLSILLFVILLALCFGIINTMLMVVFERVKELGMLMAVGMSKMKIFFMIMLETIYLSLTGGLIGIAIAYIVCKYFENVGLNIYSWKDALSSLGYSSLIYPVIDLEALFTIAVMVFFTGVLSALYPAYKALRYNPAEATRAE